MDYKTKPIGRDEIRAIATWLRSFFESKNKLRFDVIRAFEMLPLKFEGKIVTEIIEDDDISIIDDLNVPSVCIPDFCGKYHIVIREQVYDGAVKGIGGYRSHIVHEMSHAVLCILGFTPVLERSFKNNEIYPSYVSMEWQAKALAGEILVPYEKTIGMTERQIMYYCKVSKSLARHRLSLDKNKYQVLSSSK